MKANGFTDIPTQSIQDDAFQITQYVKGLSEFIMECNTPMTISIQGDWGSGKTSMMNMVRQEISDRVTPVWFNTWQYTQFNMGNELAISLLGNLLDELRSNAPKGGEAEFDKAKKVISAIGKVLQKGLVIAADMTLGGEVSGSIKDGLNSAFLTKDENDLAKIVGKLKEQFQTCVNQTVTASKSRVVVFIDDLDRLQPDKAVELLEVLKLFLDCENCVFVLAIDYSVVSQGVRKKYGDLIDDEKGKSFFDKIIQVPFKIPVTQYRVELYVDDMLKKLGIDCSDVISQSFVKLIRASIGCNPRAMKRLFNAFLLLSKVTPEAFIQTVWSKQVLFGILCLQLSFEPLYLYIASHMDDISTDNYLMQFEAIERYSDTSEGEPLQSVLGVKFDREIVRMANFMSVFNTIIDQNSNGYLDDNETAILRSILSASTITSSANINEALEDSRSYFRKYNRSLIKLVNERLAAVFPERDFKVYQPNSDKSESWKFHFAGGWCFVPYESDKGGISFEYKVMTNLRTEISTAVIWFHPYEKTMPETKFKALLGSLAESGFSYSREEVSFYKELPEMDASKAAEWEEQLFDNASSVLKDIYGAFGLTPNT